MRVATNGQSVYFQGLRFHSPYKDDSEDGEDHDSAILAVRGLVCSPRAVGFDSICLLLLHIEQLFELSPMSIPAHLRNFVRGKKAYRLLSGLAVAIEQVNLCKIFVNHFPGFSQPTDGYVVRSVGYSGL
jgi:hypothetical protein